MFCQHIIYIPSTFWLHFIYVQSGFHHPFVYMSSMSVYFFHPHFIHVFSISMFHHLHIS
jgi:hypothetical protein